LGVELLLGFLLLHFKRSPNTGTVGRHPRQEEDAFILAEDLRLQFRGPLGGSV
jgi:hypothetical protein